MKKILFIALFNFTVFNTTAQNWMTNIDQAKKIASEENKEIILVFQGSDWCAPCIKLEKEIWSTPEFISYAKEHYVMLKADFPRRKKNALSPEQQKQNNELAEKYNKNGYFPFVVVLSPQGEVLGETGYIKTSPENYISQLNSF
ncbi:MAG: thioredoxin family protein [Flavobacteriales bacterium]